MEPITTILLTALTAGAAGIATGTLQEIGKDAYISVKDRTIKRFRGKAKVDSALEMLEADPKSETRQLMLQEELEKGAAADPSIEEDADLRGALQNLLNQIEKSGSSPAATVKISLKGDGAIAHGDGAVAAGKGGVAIGGNIDKGSTKITGNKNRARDEE